MHVPRIRQKADEAPQPVAAAPGLVVHADAQSFSGLGDPRLALFLRGSETASGAHVSVDRALGNTAMFRAVSLISNAIGMLPLHLIASDTKEKARDHPVFRVLHRRPNGWQSGFDFRALMQLRTLVHGDAYALIVRTYDLRSGRRGQISRLVPIDPERVTVRQGDDMVVTYRYQPKSGAARDLKAEEVFHLRGLSLDGLNGISLVRQGAEAIGLALSAELAAGRLYRNGSFVGGALMHPNKISGEAFERLRASLAEKEGAENAGKSLILEEGMKWETFAATARDAQMAETRKLQIEEIARLTGIPRPLLAVDETSWGSGIEALGRFFVQYALGPWFEAWQQAVERSLLTDDELDLYEVKFNAGALLRGSMADQAGFFSKALGAGGAPGWMTPNEVRDLADMPSITGGDEVSRGAMVMRTEPPPAT